jgi:MFS family permease
LFVAAATGTVASRFFVSALARRFGDLRTMCIAIWCWAVSIGGLALTGVPLVAIAMYGALGVGTGLWWAVNTTVRLQITPPRLRGRMNAAYRTVSWGVVPVGAAFGGLAAKWWGLRAPFVIGGVAMLMIALAAPRYLRPVRDALA